MDPKPLEKLYAIFHWASKKNIFCFEENLRKGLSNFFYIKYDNNKLDPVY